MVGFDLMVKYSWCLGPCGRRRFGAAAQQAYVTSSPAWGRTRVRIMRTERVAAGGESRSLSGGRAEKSAAERSEEGNGQRFRPLSSIPVTFKVTVVTGNQHAEAGLARRPRRKVPSRVRDTQGPGKSGEWVRQAKPDKNLLLRADGKPISPDCKEKTT